VGKLRVVDPKSLSVWWGVLAKQYAFIRFGGLFASAPEFTLRACCAWLSPKVPA